MIASQARSIISDFAVMIAIVSMVLLDFVMGLDTPKLLVPDTVKPTRDDRGWIVDPFKNPVWTIPAAALPALLATILIFMDQQITAVIVNRKEHLLKVRADVVDSAFDVVSVLHPVVKHCRNSTR